MAPADSGKPLATETARTAGGPVTSPLRSAVGRALIVGDNAFTVDVRRWLDEAGLEADIRCVSGYLMALGEMGAGAPALLIGSLRGLGDLARSTAANLRRLAPQAFLLLLAAADEVPAARQAVAAGFDAYLPLPPDPNRLRTAILAARAQPAVPDAATPPAPETPAPSDAPLGDVDLVEHLLAGRPNLTQLAVKVIAQNSGLSEVGWTGDRKDVPAGNLVAAMTWRDESLGFMHAPAKKLGPDGPQILAGWAAWLSRWVALEQHQQKLWKTAHTDPLTGVWNRRYFNQVLADLVQRAQAERFRVTVMIFDIDDFKQYNDRYGHAAGDEILRETARLMTAVVREHDIVARIGGDEFGVIFWDAEGPRRPNSQHPTDVRRAAERFQKAVSSHQFPKLANEAPGALTISGGLAGFPWDGRTAEELIEQADQMAMASKRQGKNALSFGPGAVNHE